MGIDEERKHCKQAYKDWDFVKDIVELYSEGVSWQGCDRITVDALKTGVISMLVSGIGEFQLDQTNGQKKIEVDMPRNNPIESPGHPFLWPVTQNTTALNDLTKTMGSVAYSNDLFLLLVRDICSGMGIPFELLGANSAMANAAFVGSGLTTFRGNVGRWRKYLGNKLKITWNETWLLQGIGSFGQIYQVFRNHGIELTAMAEEVQATVLNAYESQLMLKQDYEQSVKWFFHQ